jgi:hypothetical protein
MRKREVLLVTVLVVTVVFISSYYENLEQGRVIRYDCSIAEISPDYPIAVKEACRKKKLEKDHE